MKGCLIGLSKLVAGITLAIVLFSLAGVATARYFMAKLSVLPPKPVFENDAPAIASPDTNPAASTPTVPEVAAPAPEEPDKTAVGGKPAP